MIHIEAPMLTNPRRPDLPDGIDYQLIEDHGDTMTVSIGERHEHWAVEQGYHVPQSVRTGRFFIALKRRDAQVYAAVRAAIDADEEYQLATTLEPTIRRQSVMLEQMRQAMGLAPEWVDELFREAYLLEL